MNDFESKRRLLQKELDLLKTQEQRNVMGQFSTPIVLANDIASYAKGIMPRNCKIRFLDPACGTGVFFSALINLFPDSRIEAATGYEIDDHYGKPSSELWAKTTLIYQLTDFTKQIPPPENKKYNLLICNPPYVRHHHFVDQKTSLKSAAFAAASMNLSGLAGLYCYFIALAHPWMKKNCIACWLIPSEFMDVNYGLAVKNYLLTEVTLLRIHRFDPNDIQFDDALVSSSIVFFKANKAGTDHKVKFTFGGSISHPMHEKDVESNVLSKEAKWTRFPLSDERISNNLPKLSDYFEIKRGIATGDNKFFILTLEQLKAKNLPLEHFRPILPSPRYLIDTEINTDKRGFPTIKKPLFVLDCKLPVEEIKSALPMLYSYLEEGVLAGVSKRYLCKARKIWYSQERRLESRFYCTYIGRSDNQGKKPFRFILNRSKAIVSNSYLILYPKPLLAEILERNPRFDTLIIDALNQISGSSMLDEGRVYGGGMHKMEPSELANVPAIEIGALIRQAGSQNFQN